MSFIESDWINYEFENIEFNSGNTDARPFNDIIVLEANITGTNECPKDNLPLFDQKWYGISTGCNCTAINNRRLKNSGKLAKNRCNIYEKGELCKDVEGERSHPLKTIKGKIICKKPMS
jgi:hypothetical protein